MTVVVDQHYVVKYCVLSVFFNFFCTNQCLKLKCAACIFLHAGSRVVVSVSTSRSRDVPTSRLEKNC